MCPSVKSLSVLAGALWIAASAAACGDLPGGEPSSGAATATSSAEIATSSAEIATSSAEIAAIRDGAARASADSRAEFGLPHTDPDSPRFTLAVLPDTQYLLDDRPGDADRSNPEPLAATFRYLLSPDAVGHEERNLRFMAQLGDVTEHGTPEEMALADRTFRALDGRLPYSVAAGNHDIPGGNDQRGATPFLATFGPARFSHDPTFGGASPDGYNRFHVFVAGGRRWLVLALDWRLSDAGFAWAQQVIDQHPTLPVIVATHEIAGSFDDGSAGLSGYGQELWNRLIRKNDQIFLTVNGHFWPPGRTVMTNDAGHDVQIHITNYQDRYFGGSAMLRLYHFDLARKRIDVETLSPWMLAKPSAARDPLDRNEVELTDDTNRFSIALDFDQRFAGFAPVPPRPARTATDLVIPGTVAYWRFDAGAVDGAPLPAGATIADASGHGNDLTVVRLGDSGPSAITWTTDHHPDQPAHTSLFLDGGQQPTRGAILRTGDRAPLNAMRFERGYTIEAFIKLPRAFNDGPHAFMGILSWTGESGDAGKTGGEPLEPVSSLNVTSERFLQFISYPVPRNDSSTSWSHALPVDAWSHVAVVNDGVHTIVYVDGSPITRNPHQPANGISTTGTPFVLGGTQFANNFGQGYFGLIGDVRIVDRPLAVREFMTGHARR